MTKTIKIRLKFALHFQNLMQVLGKRKNTLEFGI